MAATMKDIAKKTGLGLATVSSYFNGGNVREKNRAKIEEAIRELDFEVNEVARGLKTNTTRTIGVVIPELNNVFCSEIITAMEDVLRSHGYATMICDCRTDRRLEREAVEFLMHRRVDGIVNMPVDTSGAHLESFLKSGRPVVLIDRKIRALNCDCVFVDNLSAARNAISLLIQNGHRRIGIISGPEDVFTAQERLRGYRQILQESGIETEERLICRGDYTMESGVRGLKALVQENPDMTAVFATNYELTMGAVIGANELGLGIPEKLSMIGFDNLPFARACHPKLTIVTQPTEEIGRQAAEIMLERIREGVSVHREPTRFGENGSAETNSKWQPVFRKLQTTIVEGSSVRRF